MFHKKKTEVIFYIYTYVHMDTYGVNTNIRKDFKEWFLTNSDENFT